MSGISFTRLNADLRPRHLFIIRELLPEGRLVGREWVALNPTRTDRHAGSFRINVLTGFWADFATGDKGGDVIALCAYLQNCSQIEAARRLINMTAVRHG